MDDSLKPNSLNPALQKSDPTIKIGVQFSIVWYFVIKTGKNHNLQITL